MRLNTILQTARRRLSQWDAARWQKKIIEQAKQADVPVHRDDKLANTLSKLQIGDMIPPELYEVVAEILVFVDGMDKIKAKVKDYNSKKG